MAMSVTQHQWAFSWSINYTLWWRLDLLQQHITIETSCFVVLEGVTSRSHKVRHSVLNLCNRISQQMVKIFQVPWVQHYLKTIIINLRQYWQVNQANHLNYLLWTQLQYKSQYSFQRNLMKLHFNLSSNPLFRMISKQRLFHLCFSAPFFIFISLL